MTRETRRVLLARGYILHHRPYRDTSRILEVFTHDFGRLTLFARGVRGPKAKLAAYLQPFRLLLLSWSGRGEAPQLTGAESPGEHRELPAASLMSGFYLNELLLKLTTRHDPLPAAFESYHRTLESLKDGAPLQPALRIFEKRLLEAIGYGLDLSMQADTAERIEPEAFYLFRAGQGLVRTAPETSGALKGSSLMSLAREDLTDARELEDARRLLQSALAHCLEGRELMTRDVARSLVRASR